MDQVHSTQTNSRFQHSLLCVFTPALLICLSIFTVGACQEPTGSSAGSSAKPAAQGSSSKATPASPASGSAAADGKIQKTEAQWRAQLTPEEYEVTRNKGTERPFTGKYWDNKKPGVYACKCCGLPLFDASTKFKSGTGWPSFYKAIDDKAVTSIVDNSHGMRRTENTCSRCDAHLGHVFKDGPAPTGLRYCMNSASLEFKPQQDAASSTTPAATSPADEAQTESP